MKTTRIRILAAALPLLAACAGTAVQGRSPAATSQIGDAESLVRAMYARYEGRWYETLSFKQTVTRRNPDGTARPQEVWTEHAQIPGRLRIDFGDRYSGNGVLYAGDSTHVFRGGSRVRSVAQRNPLMLLGFDVYGQDPARSIEILREEGFDLSRFHVDTWEGRPVYVAGADSGDLHSKQFWVDQESLLFVRLIEPAAQDTTKTSDIRFNKYERIGSGWIAPEVVILLDGKEVMREEYFDMRAGMRHDPALFDPARWSAGARP